MAKKRKVFRLVYADFNSNNPEKLKEYYTKTMGYRVTAEKEGVVYLSNALDHHNIVITPSEESGIRSFGYQLDGKLSLMEMKSELQQQGIQSEIKTGTKPGVAEILELRDPDGNIVELFTDMEQVACGYSDSGIVPLKLGHIAFYANHTQEVVNFYQDALGFTFTDKIGDDFANFLTCNSDHHVLNIVSSNQSKLHHIAFQVKDSSHHERSSDLLAQHNHPVLWGPSRHTAGHNIATYHYDPDGNVVELYTDMDVYVPEQGIYEPRPWHKELPLKPKIWKGLSSWGTEFEFDLAKI